MPAMYLPLLLSALAFLTSVFSFFYFISYLKRRTGQERILSEMREEVNNILRSIDETTDRDISLIEEREKNLKSLLEDIEKRLKVYIREKEKRREAEEAYAALTPQKPADTVSVPSAHGPARTEGAYTELGKNRYRGNERDISVGAESTGESENSSPAFPLPRFRVKPEASAREEPPAPPPVGEQIHELIRAGLPVPAIAARLGISIAEVEFAEALLKRRDE